jgi:hypothetical protein
VLDLMEPARLGKRPVDGRMLAKTEWLRGAAVAFSRSPLFPAPGSFIGAFPVWDQLGLRRPGEGRSRRTPDAQKIASDSSTPRPLKQ